MMGTSIGLLDIDGDRLGFPDALGEAEGIEEENTNPEIVMSSRYTRSTSPDALHKMQR